MSVQSEYPHIGPLFNQLLNDLLAEFQLTQEQIGRVMGLTTQKICEVEDAAAPDPLPEEVTEEMLQAAMREAVSVGLLPKWASTESYVKHWDGMKSVLRAALGA